MVCWKSMEQKNKSKIHDLEEKLPEAKPAAIKNGQMITTKMVAIFVAGAVILGIGSGYIINMVAGGSGLGGLTASNKKDNSGSGKESAGVLDKKTSPDSAEGVLKEGGIEGEGSYHLERPGGKSQNVYLTSTAVDLSTFLGKKVKVWGQTFAAEKAGWLMDVGYIEVVK